jgi:hypothetical protein
MLGEAQRNWQVELIPRAKLSGAIKQSRDREGRLNLHYTAPGYLFAYKYRWLIIYQLILTTS